MLNSQFNNNFNSINVENRSGRKLTIYQYFEMLQIEHVVASLRVKIYRTAKDKDYWSKVMENKRVKIEEISDRNSLPNIFTDSSMKEDIQRRVFNEYSHPNFHYKDDEQKATQGYYDLLYYYYPGSEVSYNLFGDQKVGKIAIYTPFEPHCHVVDIKDENMTPVQINIAGVKRIL